MVFTSNHKSNIDLFMKTPMARKKKRASCTMTSTSIQMTGRETENTFFTPATRTYKVVTVPDLTSRLYLKAASVLRNGQFSPDGKWVAYASNERGKGEIYVTSFPEPQGKWQVSTGGGEQPRWRGDGKELFYLSSNNNMMVAPVTIGAKFDSGTPIPLFQANPREQLSLNDVFVRRDGKEFLINTRVRQAETVPMSVVPNWDAKVNK